uniref:Retrotransposon gag domain-containing protein n=1 Tax=Spongospora subterranea TaxID=70186 RepID=A0A0H5R3N9_9EUKA|eukprot:CRZ08516.1 hypothetical protein [Spongospora subterranea]
MLNDPSPDHPASLAQTADTTEMILQLQQTIQSMQEQLRTLEPRAAQPQYNHREPKAHLPEPFNGDPTSVRGFINQILLVIQQQPVTYSTDTSRILLIGSLLTGLAREWFNPYFENQDPALFNNFQQFLYLFRQRFDDPNRATSAADMLSMIKQGRRTVAAYASHVQQLVADAGWDERAAQHVFRRGLNDEIQDLLLTVPTATSLVQLITDALRLDQRLGQRQAGRTMTPLPQPQSYSRPPPPFLPRQPSKLFRSRPGSQRPVPMTDVRLLIVGLDCFISVPSLQKT